MSWFGWHDVECFSECVEEAEISGKGMFDGWVIEDGVIADERED